MSLDQLMASTTGTFVVGIEKIDCNDRPRRDAHVFVKGPDLVIHDSDDKVRTIGVGLKRVAVHKVSHLARSDVDLGFAADDQINIVFIERAHAARVAMS